MCGAGLEVVPPARAALRNRMALRRDAARKSALTHVLRTFFDNSAEQAVAALLELKGPRLSEAELDRVSLMVENAKKEGR